ncbi:hypothetical protein PPTG_22732 [Phytophthora nicotianae INRA-310]|uniref:Uncharacterized protein n=1 Tax=Phytophthora nicotianae (strain INRA-310) TaxID=761204 RepID=W2QCZ9_PHYN3|nr:hypothetical protein PPTG_22732 [Phytophthora nicotianae INRA-310]ETN10384.1 hypothetical protein PPTG_22732 [Phytophthora nicotianae INRA-310]
MIPAGIRLDLFHGAAQLPNEVRIPLVKTKNMVDSMEYSAHINARPTEALDIPGHESREEGRPVSGEVSCGRPVRIRLTNISEQTAYVPAFDRMAMLVPIGDLPRGESYVRSDSKKYKDWQVLAYENCLDQQLFRREFEHYEQCLATQPPSVERRTYPTPTDVMKRSSEDALDASADRLTCAERWEKILEQRERDEGRLDSWMTNEDTFEIRFSGTRRTAVQQAMVTTAVPTKSRPSAYMNYEVKQRK